MVSSAPRNSKTSIMATQGSKTSWQLRPKNWKRISRISRISSITFQHFDVGLQGFFPDFGVSTLDIQHLVTLWPFVKYKCQTSKWKVTTLQNHLTLEKECPGVAVLVVRSFSAFSGIRFVLWIPGSASFGFALSPSFSFWLWAPCRKLKAKKFKHATETSGCQWVRMDQDEQMVRWTSRARRTLHQVFCQTIPSDLQEPVIEVGEESLWTQKSKKWWKGCRISISIGFCADEFGS